MARIAIFDSGVGGLSVHAALRQRLPNCDYVFISDNQAHPYGTKSDDFLIPRVCWVVEQIVVKHRPDVLVIACNTASTVVLPSLRKRFSLPIVGVVPAIKPASKQSKTRCIALLATPATIARRYTADLIDKFAADCQVVKQGSSRLVSLAEAKIHGRSVNRAEVHAEIVPILEVEQCDVLVLACTHFPLLYKEIESIVSQKSGIEMRIIDSGEAIARRVASLLPNNHSLATGNSASYMTQAINSQSSVAAALQSRQLPYQGLLDYGK